jgi:hypothetical protein
VHPWEAAAAQSGGNCGCRRPSRQTGRALGSFDQGPEELSRTLISHCSPRCRMGGRVVSRERLKTEVYLLDRNSDLMLRLGTALRRQIVICFDFDHNWLEGSSEWERPLILAGRRCTRVFARRRRSRWHCSAPVRHVRTSLHLRACHSRRADLFPLRPSLCPPGHIRTASTLPAGSGSLATITSFANCALASSTLGRSSRLVSSAAISLAFLPM